MDTKLRQKSQETTFRQDSCRVSHMCYQNFTQLSENFKKRRQVSLNSPVTKLEEFRCQNLTGKPTKTQQPKLHFSDGYKHEESISGTCPVFVEQHSLMSHFS